VFTIVTNLVFPIRFMLLSLSHLPGTIVSLLWPPTASSLRTLFSPSRLKTVWFARFWLTAGPNVRMNASPRVVPLLAGNLSGGRIVAEPAHPPLSGTVLELGPGSGLWAEVIARHNPAVHKVYGVEPSADMCAALTATVRKAGLDRDGLYEVVPVGIEELALGRGPVGKGQVDCVVSLLCLCGIPDPETNIPLVYDLLKPGGRWYVYEHVRYKTSQGWAMACYQGESAAYLPLSLSRCDTSH
jgi:SAM-dependent methyltransferase